METIRRSIVQRVSARKRRLQSHGDVSRARAPDCQGVSLLLILSLGACTNTQLASSTVRVAGTVMDIEYQMIMDNLARMQENPAALPSQIRIKQGTVQVSDEVGIYSLRFSGDISGTFGGPRAERTISEQWGADAITDPLALKQLQDVYRTTMGLPRMTGASFLEAERQSSETKESSSGGKDKKAHMKIDLDRDVPREWFHVGTKDQVSPEAQWVSHSGRHWVWVTADGLSGFSRFTLLVLSIAKLGPGTSQPEATGLMYTGGGR